MKLTKGERWALLCYAVVLAGFMPPVIVWANSVGTRVMGLPFLLFWAALMVLVTAGMMTLASWLKDRVDR